MPAGEPGFCGRGREPTTISEDDAHTATEQGRKANADGIRVMTFNIRWQGHSNGIFYDSEFDRRKPLILDVLRNFDADVIGLQEASIEQRTEISPELAGFGMHPLPSEAGDECILYRLSRFDVKDSGHQYLRKVAEEPGTNIGVRDFFWVYLFDKITGKRFYVVNLHLDHRSSVRGRQLDAVLVGRWISNRKYSDPVVLLGDFNGTPEGPRFLYLTGQSDYPDEFDEITGVPMEMLDTFTVANPDELFSGTSNAGRSGIKNNNQIDYIFVPRGTKVIDSSIIYYHKDGSYPSDHFPLLSEFELE